jgi:ATP-binding cassette subfamily F protein 3
VLLKKSPLLLLDEPTNHLDFDTVEALTQALTTFEGSLVVVSHDRSFIRRVASKILEIRDGKVQFYPGTYDEYVWSLEKGVLAEINAANSANKGGDSASSPGAKANKESDKSLSSYEQRKRNESEKRKLEKESQRLEKLMETLTAKQTELNESLVTAEASEVARLADELTKVSQSLIDTEESYLQVLEGIDALS